MTKNEDHANTILSVIEDGSLERLQIYIAKAGIAEIVNTLTNSDGLTPYLKAAEAGKTAIYDYFASLPHFDSNKTDNYGLNALTLATLRSRTQMFDHLVEEYDFKIDQTIRTEGIRHITPIYYAVERGNKEMVKHLVSRHLYTASDDLMQYGTSLGKTEITDYLKNIANLNQQLSAEITDHNLQNFRQLCEKQGAKPKSAQQNLAEFAAINGAIDIFEYLIDVQGFNERDVDLKYLAVESLFINNSKLLEVLLLKYDFNPEQKVIDDHQHSQNLYEYSSYTPKSETGVYLNSVQLLNSAFTAAIVEQNIDLVSEILSQQKVLKHNINEAAIQCVSDGNLELYQIISRNPKFDKNTCDEDGNSLLFHAVVSGNTDLVDHLISDQQFSFATESRNKLMMGVLEKCDDSKKAAMVSYLINKDIGFVFVDDFAEFPGIETIAKQTKIGPSADRLKDYSQLANSNNQEAQDIIIAAQEKVRAIFHKFLDQNQSERTESQIIKLFKDLAETTENPYSTAKYLFQSNDDPQHQYLDLARYLTRHNFRNLYRKMAGSEPELRADQNRNGAAFLMAAFEQNSVDPSKSVKYLYEHCQFFEFAIENFGDVKEINRILVHKDFVKDTDIQAPFVYLRSMINSGRLPSAKLSEAEIVSCIIPQDEDLKYWKSKNPEVFYSFQKLENGNEIEFNSAEKNFFNQLVVRSQKDMLVPVRPINLSEEELQAIREQRFDKNVFFIVKQADLNANAVYPRTKQDGNMVGHKIIIVGAGRILDNEYSMLHQLAIGVADLKHSSYYNSEIDTEPNCDYGVTISDTVMSHLCDEGTYSGHCYNLLIMRNQKDQFKEEVKFRESDVTAITTSLVTQYPDLAQKAIEFDNARKFCPADERAGYVQASQIMLATVLLGSVIGLLINRVARPNHVVGNAVANQAQNLNNKHTPNDSTVPTRDYRSA